MRVILQRVSNANVKVDGSIVGEIQQGFCLLVGLHTEDTKEIVQKVAKKCASLRVFEDENEKMNLGLQEVGGKILSVSQFTLYGTVKKGNRPSFGLAMSGEKAKELYDYFNTCLRDLGCIVETGVFGAMMDVQLCNDGPTTIIVDSEEL